ncbi:MAG TPA: c-type cytochrome [Burkholderiaceae bacterium]|nr:c-type cytochrome [Burkholderiaceae bacterium]
MRDALVGGALAAAAAASVSWAAPAPHQVPDTIAQRVQACAACHGQQGVATREGYLPRIAGKPAGYLYNQLLNFRDGRRHSGAMERLTRNMTDAYLQEIAGHFAALDLPYAPTPARLPAAAAELERGAQLVQRGDAALRVPACTQCHGAAMTGIAPAIPGLLGLPRDYVLAQLGAWRAGQRRAHAPDCMGQISRRLDAADLNAVASYLAMQAMPANAQPAPALPAPLPMSCGGIAR